MDTAGDLSMGYQTHVDVLTFDDGDDDDRHQEQQHQLGEPNLIARGDLEVEEPHLGMEFGELEMARDFYFDYAERLGFRVRASRFRTSRRDNSMIMRRFVCYKEGFYASSREKIGTAKERKKRGSLREGCGAMLEVVRSDGNRWVVSKLVVEHTHCLSPIDPNRSRNRKSEVASNPNVPHCSSPAGRNRFSWGGGEAFNLLEYFKKMQAKNPAFFYAVQLDDRTNSMVNVLWADPRGRIAYSYFGDTVAMDTTFRKSRRDMVPFVTFTGTNHHLQPVVFACAVMVDDSEPSLVWLLSSFQVAMCGRHPVSFVIEQAEPLDSAVATVFPRTRRRYGKWQILGRCSENLPDVCSTPVAKRAFKKELGECMDDPETAEELRLRWEGILCKYDLRENPWMRALYDARRNWARVYLKDTFFAEMSPAQRSESMSNFFRRNFEKRTTSSLAEFIHKFDRAMMVQYEKEVQADLANACTRPVLSTGSAIEKQAAEAYTKTIFSIFQEELRRSSLHNCLLFTCEDGVSCKYHVVPPPTLGGMQRAKPYTVTFSYAQVGGTSCSCSKFEFSGILCSHILRVFAAVGVSSIPEEFLLKRWKKIAKSGPILFEPLADAGAPNLFMHTNSLFLDVLKYAAECATSLEMYSASKMALKQAYSQVLAKKKLHPS